MFLDPLSLPMSQHVLIFQHIPWFISEEDEPRGYFNIPPTTREKWLAAIAGPKDAAGKPLTRAVFCGHFHNNVLGRFHSGQVEHVITSSIGRQISLEECACNQDLGQCAEYSPGARLVRVGDQGLTHEVSCSLVMTSN